MRSRQNRILLIILDGWGLNPISDGNAIALANTPEFDRFQAENPYTSLVASGEAIDLPPGHMGNSEVGHQNIGAGRIVPQASSTITRAISSRSFFDKRKIIPKAMKNAKMHGKTVHLFGLLSDGLVHSHINHAFALMDMAKQIGVNCTVHALLDGRDVPPMSAKKYLKMLEAKLSDYDNGRIGTLTGRTIYERDHEKWHLVRVLYELLIQNKGKHTSNAISAVDDAYTNGVSIDEHIPPYVVVDKDDKPVSEISHGDTFINWNFRGDRATMISHAIVDAEFNNFKRVRHPKVNYICMSLYDNDISALIAYPPVKLGNVISEVISRNGLKQYKTAETTKFFHLTFFFNCRRKKPFHGEVQEMVPSKKTEYYDEMPEMSAREVADGMSSALESDIYDFCAVNFANPDMVGHTGNLNATIKAVEVVDKNLGRVIRTAQKHSYSVIVTADHGNADSMIDPHTGDNCTAHTANDVPFILLLTPELRSGAYEKVKLKTKGLLGNIAPTILELMGLEKPNEMVCQSLIE